VFEQFTNESQLTQLQQNQLNAEIDYIRFQDQIRDEINWTRGGKDFTIKSLYQFLQNFPITRSDLKNIWKLVAPLRVQIFGWLMLKNSILTIENFKK
jgi:zinc-binding in reverse transcriptase